jgi:hypothetical protein
MLLAVIQSDAQALLHHWLLEIRVQPSKFLSKIQQAFPELSPVCTPPRSLCFLLVSYMLVQGALPP